MDCPQSSNNDQMSGLDGQGHPEPMTAEGAANTLKYIADDHPCCAHALEEITLWLESLCPQCNAPRMYYDEWNCPTERCDGETGTASGPETIWLQWNGDGQPDGSPVSVGDVTWSTEQVFEHDERYTKATKEAAAPTEDKYEWKELYNLADFDWDTMPEAGRRRFRELVLEAADKALERRRNKQPQPPKNDDKNGNPRL